MVAAFSLTAGSFSHTPGSSSRTAGTLNLTVRAFSHTGDILQLHGWKSQPRPCFHLTAWMARPAVLGKCPATRLPRPAAPEKHSGVRFQPPAVGFGPLGASLVWQTLRSITPPTPRHEAVVLGLCRSSHRAALHMGFAQSDVVRNPRARRSRLHATSPKQYRPTNPET